MKTTTELREEMLDVLYKLSQSLIDGDKYETEKQKIILNNLIKIYLG